MRTRPKAGHFLEDWQSLYSFSIDHPELSWPALWSFCRIRGEMGAPPYLIDGEKLPGAQYFPNARLNFAENLLEAEGDGLALVFWGEDQVKRTHRGNYQWLQHCDFGTNNTRSHPFRCMKYFAFVFAFTSSALTSGANSTSLKGLL